MSLTTPTTKELSDLIIAQLESTLNQTIPLLPKSFLRVLAKTLAGVFILLYKYAGFIFLQIFVATASIKDTTILGQIVSPLKEWGRLVGVGDPVAATNAELLIDITVTNQTSSLPAGTQLLNADNGVTYILLASVPLNAPTVQGTVRAAADQSAGTGAGTIGNLDPGAILSFANPLPNVNRDVVVNTQTVTAADEESSEAYRQRIIDRFQKRPQGGALADYEIWGEETPGIINVYPYTGDTPGEVDLYSEATPESSGSPDGIPTQAQLDAVKESTELDQDGLATRRPANAFVNSFPITRTPFDVTVFGLIVDNTADVQASINTATEEYFLNREPNIPGLSTPPRRDRITVSGLSGAIEDVVSSANGIFDSVTIEQGTVDINTYPLGQGEKSKLGSPVSFV